VRVLLLLLVVLRLAGARGFDFSPAFVDHGLVFCVGGWVAPVEGVVEGSAEGFACALEDLVSMDIIGWRGMDGLRGYRKRLPLGSPWWTACSGRGQPCTAQVGWGRWGWDRRQIAG
jgi:hypothetical protein